MNKFKDLGIKVDTQSFIGDKIKIKKILNMDIVVHSFKIVPSKYEGTRLDMQISIGDKKHVAWTSSQYLMELIKKVPEDKFPIETRIIEENEHYEFS